MKYKESVKRKIFLGIKSIFYGFGIGGIICLILLVTKIIPDSNIDRLSMIIIPVSIGIMLLFDLLRNYCAIELDNSEIIIKKRNKIYNYSFNSYVVTPVITDHFLNGAKYMISLKLIIENIETKKSETFKAMGYSNKAVQEIVAELEFNQVKYSDKNTPLNRPELNEENFNSKKISTKNFTLTQDEIIKDAKKHRRILSIILWLCSVVLFIIYTVSFISNPAELADDSSAGKIFLVIFLVFFSLCISFRRLIIKRKAVEYTPEEVLLSDERIEIKLLKKEKMVFLWEEIKNIVVMGKNSREPLRKIQIFLNNNKKVEFYYGIKWNNNKLTQNYDEIMAIFYAKLFDLKKIEYDLIS
jgi:hypothetical protein